jgi:hypothetical protein
VRVNDADDLAFNVKTVAGFKKLFSNRVKADSGTMRLEEVESILTPIVDPRHFPTAQSLAID